MCALHKVNGGMKRDVAQGGGMWMWHMEVLEKLPIKSWSGAQQGGGEGLCAHSTSIHCMLGCPRGWGSSRGLPALNGTQPDLKAEQHGV